MIGRSLRSVFGGTDRTFVELAKAQVTCAHEAALLVRMTVAGELEPSDARNRMRTIEHEGDHARSLLVDELRVAFTSPVDREDLFRLSRSIDDVLDNLRDLAREIDLYNVGDCSSLAPLVDAVITAIQRLEVAVSLLHSPAEIADATLTVKKGANEIRRRYQHSVAELFDEELNMETMKRRELLRRLDVVGLRLGEAADSLADGTIKRSP